MTVESRTKFLLDDETILRLAKQAGVEGVRGIAPLGAGEFNAVYALEADKGYVLKVAPPDSAPVMTYEKDMLRSEVHWYGVMRERTDIRVPEVYCADFSRALIPAGWFLMERMAGTTREAFEMSEAERAQQTARTAEMVASMHRVRNDKFGYIQNGLYDNWYLALRSMTQNLIGDCRRLGADSPRGERFLAYIDRFRDVFAAAECCMVNFDIWDSNIMCTREDGAIRYAWIDPERCFWGDRIMDFICLEMFAPLEGKTASLAAYNAVAALPVTPGHDEKLRYAAAQGLMALIMEAEKYSRYTPELPGWARNVGGSEMLFAQAFEAFARG